MTTLTTAPLVPLLDRLFEEAAAASPATSPALADLFEERERLMRSKTGYRDFYQRLKDFPLAISRETGALLYMLARSTQARTIVEFGTSFGISTLHLAAALRDNGGGRLITTEFEPSKVARARDHLTEGGLIDLVEIREGDARRRSPRTSICPCGLVEQVSDRPSSNPHAFCCDGVSIARVSRRRLLEARPVQSQGPGGLDLSDRCIVVNSISVAGDASRDPGFGQERRGKPVT